MRNTARNPRRPRTRFPGSSKVHPKTLIRRASSVAEAIGAAIAIIAKWSTAKAERQYCWFRGCRDSRFPLTPGAYRFTADKYDEHQHLVYVVQEGPAYANVGSLMDWSTYYLCQHHGSPTRLLDWTESLPSALFFALHDAQKADRPCVWILDPAALNKAAAGYEGVISPENNAPVDAWLPNRIREPQPIVQAWGQGTLNNDLPLAIIPRKTNERIVAQQGMFTVHGRSRDALQLFVSTKTSKPPHTLARIDLNLNDRQRWMSDLDMLGTRRHTVFPELSQYILYLKEYFGHA